MEHTIARGRQITKDSSFTHDYTGLFPTIYLNYQLNKLHALTFSYGRRISRPNYMDLNPWVLFIDSLTYMQGNPYLLPQYAHNFELRHSYKNSLTTIVNYTLTDDVISQLSKQNTAKRITFLIPDNVARLENIGISITAPIKFAKWWNTNLFVNVFNNHFKGVYYNSTRRQNDPIDIQYTSYLVNVTNNLSFKKGWSGEISGWYRGKGVEQLTIYDPIYFMMIGAQKNLMKDRSILRMNFRDPFSWYKSFGRTLYSDIDIKNKRTFSSRVLVVSFSYRFGKKTVAQARRKTTGTNEEESRVGQGQQ